MHCREILRTSANLIDVINIVLDYKKKYIYIKHAFLY